MKIVIDIPKTDYEYLKSHNKDGLYNVILNGTLLPEHHGRLIDENELKKEAIRCEWSRNMYSMLDHTLSYMKPIIKADKESESK